MVAEILDVLTPRTANQCRALLIDIFNHAASKGLCPDNPAASTINRIRSSSANAIRQKD
jgi:enterobacteria phage integrase